MQAVILAAGRGTRMKSLTETMPKPMLTVAGRTLLEHKFDILPDEVDEIIIIVGYLGGVIQKHFGGFYKGKRILYVEQDVLNGTAGALWLAKDILKGKFIVMMGDDIYALKDIRKCLKHEWAILVQERNPLHSGGKVIMDTHRRITGIEEGTHKGSGCINAALYVLDTRVFDYPLIAKSSDSTEYGLPQVMMQACKDIDIHAVPATLWIQITEPADIAKAEKALEGE